MSAKVIAETILAQLGGRRFTMMTGSKNYLALDVNLTEKYLGGLRFSIARNKTSANRCEIRLMSNDTYTVEFGRLAGVKYKVMQTFEDVYNDQLASIFESYTGLYTKF